MPKRGRPFQKGQSGNPGGRPKGGKTFAIRELVAEALADPSTREAAIREFRRALARTRTVIPSLEFAARVNKEIGQGSGDRSADGVTIVFMSNVDPMKLAAAKSRALPLPALPASNGTNGAHWWPPSRPRTDGPPTRRPPILRRRRGRRTVPASVEFEN